MSFPFMYVLGLLIMDSPWYVMAAIPFWNERRISKGAVIAVFAVSALLRPAMGGLFAAYVPNWELYDQIYYITHTLILFGLYFVCFKIRAANLAFMLLVILLISSSVNHLAYLITLPFNGDMEGIELVTNPLCIGVTFVLTLATFPVLYRVFRGIMRRAFTELRPKSVLSLCVAPALFFFIDAAFILTLGTFTNALVALVVVLSGLLCAYINTRMILNAAEQSRVERELAAKTDFYRRMSHDIRTPLTKISTNIQIANRQETTDHERLIRSQDEIMEIAAMIDAALSDDGDTDKGGGGGK